MNDIRSLAIELTGMAKELEDAVFALKGSEEDGESCGCLAVAGYKQALVEVISVLEQTGHTACTINGEKAVLADRSDLIEIIQNRIAQVEAAEARQVEAEPASPYERVVFAEGITPEEQAVILDSLVEQFGLDRDKIEIITLPDTPTTTH